MQKHFRSLLVVLSALMGLFILAPAAHAKATQLPAYLRNHTFYRLTDGSQGGFHNKTTFKGNHLTVRFPEIHQTYHWRLSGLKRHSSKVYYGRLHYVGGHSELIKIKIFSHKHFDFIPKHSFPLKGNYTGNEKYGATIFKR